MEFNISTNILRDQDKNLNYVVTPNATKIFERIFCTENAVQNSYTIIGNYGTGKSTFLWAMEKNLLKEKIYFSNKLNSTIKSYQFLKIIGDSTRLNFAFQKALKLQTNATSRDIIDELEKRRKLAQKKKEAFVIIIDEFGKFLEYINKNKEKNDLYLLQLISEWVNDSEKKSYFIITLHQSFVSYSNSLDITEKLEWEKIKGRFAELLFNEPVEQLLFFASQQLEKISIPSEFELKFKQIIQVITDSSLVAFNEKKSVGLANKLFPIDWLSANILVQSLQRYGQNERSLFTFLNEFNRTQLNENIELFNVSNVYDYLINNLSSDIQNYNNPHRPQWMSCMRALERAELIFNDEYNIASSIIKTICLVNIFCKTGGTFNHDFTLKYIELTTSFDNKKIDSVLKKLEKSGVIRFYKHSNKINFLEGTDIDIEQELTDISKEISMDFSIADELVKLINFPVENVKKHSYERGTPRYFEYRILNDIDDVKMPEGIIDGYINLVFNSKIEEKRIEAIVKKSDSYLFVLYKNSEEISSEIFTISKYKLLIQKFANDINALKLLNEELQHHINKLYWLVTYNLYQETTGNIWFYKGKKNEPITSRKHLNNLLTDICDKEYSKSPIIKNELFNRENLSAQINSARKLLMKQLLENENKESIGFAATKFPPEKSIYLSLIQQTGIHKQVNGVYSLGEPNKDTSFDSIWNASVKFLNDSNNSKRNIKDLYDLLKEKPFKMKKGFIEFWVPLFLIIKRKEYGLFHETSGFISFLTNDILDLIHKAPSNYYIKKYDVEKNKDLLNLYKNLTNENTSEDEIKMQLISIFRHFLLLNNSLNEFNKTTKGISLEAQNLRTAIKEAKDPEEALFVKFPEALGYHFLNTRKPSEEDLKKYTSKIKIIAKEIKESYIKLLKKIELVILESAEIKEPLDFDNYSLKIKDKLNGINKDLLSKEQKDFYFFFNNFSSGKDSWIESVSMAALGKPVEKILDNEIPLFLNNLKVLIKGLLKSARIHNSKNNNIVLLECYYGDGKPSVEIEINVEAKKNESLKTELLKKLEFLNPDEQKQILFELLKEI